MSSLEKLYRQNSSCVCHHASCVGGRGYFEIGIVDGKTPQNIGMLWRTAHNLGANGIFTIGCRYRTHPCDTTKAARHIPLREFADFKDFCLALPKNVKLIGVELTDTAIPLPAFDHPERAFYLLGAEDHGIPEGALAACDDIIKIPFGFSSINVSVAGSIIMYDRLQKTFNRNARIDAAAINVPPSRRCSNVHREGLM